MDLEQAELIVKDNLLLAINIGLQEINKELLTIKRVPGLKLMVTGGQALENYFPDSPELRTHDFDLKLVAPTQVTITRDTRRFMLFLGAIIADNLTRRANMYVTGILPQLRSTLRQKYGVQIIGDQPFNVQKVGSSLFTVFFKLQKGNTVRSSPLADVFVVKPSDIYHYKMFAGLQDSDPILSEDAGAYYIPYEEIDGIPHAKLGYLLWDTLRMIEYTRELGLPKFQRYVNKRNSIIQGLNNPEQKLSCDMMQGYVQKCNKDFSSGCRIGDKVYNNIEDIITLAISEGVIPADPQVVQRVRDNFSMNYLCEKVKKIL